MKFGQFMSYFKKKSFHQKIIQKLRPENQFQALLCLQRIKQNLKYLKQSTYYIFNRKTIKISPNQHATLPRFLFTEDSLKIKKGSELEFFYKKIYFLMLHELFKFHYQDYFPSYSIKYVFHVQAFDDVMTFEYLKIQNLIISRTKEAFEVK